MSDTKSMLADQLNAVTSNAEQTIEHYDNFDDHMAEIENGEREYDDVLTDGISEDYEIMERWDEDIISIEKKVIFEFWFSLGGPNVLAEVKCTPIKHQFYTEYDIQSITLEGYWGSDKEIRNVSTNDPLWTLIARTVEAMGETE